MNCFDPMVGGKFYDENMIHNTATYLKKYAY